MKKEQYEQDLHKRQEEHLKNIRHTDINWHPCLHDSCPECLGTGIKKDGSMCIHMLHCTCPKCTPNY